MVNFKSQIMDRTLMYMQSKNHLYSPSPSRSDTKVKDREMSEEEKKKNMLDTNRCLISS